MLDTKDLEMIEAVVMKAVEPLYKEAKEIAYTLENDIRERINVIVEGNTDLKYKVNQIMGSDVERELMKLRIHRLERTVMRMKERLEMV